MRVPAKTVGGVIVAGVLLGLCGCASETDPWPAAPGPRVIVSFPPLYSFAANVAGDDASVLCLLTTAGPHDYDPSPQDALKLQRANLFVINGLSMEDHFAGKLKNNSGNPDLRLLAAGEAVPADRLRLLEDSHHGPNDPHVWLGIPEAVRMVERIRDKLAEMDPARASGARRRAAEYIDRLHGLQEYGQSRLADKKERQLVSYHDSLFYFARSFDLKVVDCVQSQCGAEIDPKHLAELIGLCKARNLRVIAGPPGLERQTKTRELLNQMRAKGIADPVYVVVDPMETAPADEVTAAFYERHMRSNIDNLAEQLR